MTDVGFMPAKQISFPNTLETLDAFKNIGNWKNCMHTKELNTPTGNQAAF